MASSRPGEYDFADEDDEPRPARRSGDRPRPKRPGGRRRDPDDDPPRARKPAPAATKGKSPLWGLLILVPLIGLAIFMGVRQSRQRSAEQGSFAAEMDKLVAPPAPGPVQATPGKVAIIDVDKRELHYLHDRSGGPDSEYQAATPQEAAIIVQVRVTDQVVREYLNGRKGVKQTFHLTVIDKATWTKVGERSFEGGDPPESIRLKGGGGTNEPVTGPLPSKEIYAYLRELGGG
jgi:hypothetical protein